jgi:hypothetical protein
MDGQYDILNESLDVKLNHQSRSIETDSFTVRFWTVVTKQHLYGRK